MGQMGDHGFYCFVFVQLCTLKSILKKSNCCHLDCNMIYLSDLPQPTEIDLRMVCTRIHLWPWLQLGVKLAFLDV